MADILIRGMEMPKDGHIVVRIYANGDVCEPTPCPGVWRKVGELSPLPEKHGRLGDLDALIAKHSVTKFDWSEAVDVSDIEAAPTIVPADVTDIDVGSKKEGGTDNG